MTRTHQHPLKKILESRIAIIDGAMGTTIRTYGMTEADIRGDRFKDSTKSLLNNGDIFSLTKPEMIGDIHRRFLEAGADIIETNTFGATAVAQDDYGLGAYARELNVAAARIAREACDQYSSADKPRFVAGALGPTPRTASISPDVNDPAARNQAEQAAGFRADIRKVDAALLSGVSGRIQVKIWLTDGICNSQESNESGHGSLLRVVSVTIESRML
jgi:5-methyltetrahydrofolate--homocysteine methyltransferase